ncbi:MAG: DMT family transporter, partial [Alphaproteobacteria bacterium]
MTRTRATVIGFGAVLMWALLALLTVGSAPVPPFQLAAISFAIGAAIGLIWTAASGTLTELARVPLSVYGFGIAGLFGYHALYFFALRLAPPAEAGLIAYLWPLLIVLFSGLLPGERLRAGHVLGAALAFAGAALIIGGRLTGVSAAALPGLGLAFLCALTWSGYSVISRRLGAVPTASVTVFCAGSAVLALAAHLAFEVTTWPEGGRGWASTLLLGLGPVGLAFYLWDIGVKRGDIQLLGVASYAA